MKKRSRRSPLYDRIRRILEAARSGISRTVNTTQVIANWLIGQEIVEEQQQGEKRAKYGESLLAVLSARLTTDYGKGFTVRHLEFCRGFYLGYPRLLEKSNAVRSISSPSANQGASKISNAPRAELEISHTSCDRSWQPGLLHPNLSWTHYRTLLRVEKPEARAFYEIEAIQNNWAARELERQINSLLYERLALSRDKKGLMRLAKKGQEIQGPLDVFKDPMVLEFLKIPAPTRLVETKLEEALLNDLQAFLLELGKGFAFVARQERITLDGDHFYIDLVFYHTILKCFILLDLKVGKLMHQDLGQLQLYVHYYDQERRTPGDNPTLGLILCTDKNDAVVKYTLGPHQERRIFASRYKLHLPTEAELEAEIRRELKKLKRDQPEGKN